MTKWVKCIHTSYTGSDINEPNNYGFFICTEVSEGEYIRIISEEDDETVNVQGLYSNRPVNYPNYLFDFNDTIKYQKIDFHEYF